MCLFSKWWPSHIPDYTLKLWLNLCSNWKTCVICSLTSLITTSLLSQFRGSVGSKREFKWVDHTCNRHKQTHTQTNIHTLIDPYRNCPHMQQQYSHFVTAALTTSSIEVFSIMNELPHAHAAQILPNTGCPNSTSTFTRRRPGEFGSRCYSPHALHSNAQATSNKTSPITLYYASVQINLVDWHGDPDSWLTTSEDQLQRIEHAIHTEHSLFMFSYSISSCIPVPPPTSNMPCLANIRSINVISHG